MTEINQKHHLTRREMEVLRLLVLSWSNKEIASNMGISTNTVKAFLHLVMMKMGVPSRSGVVACILLLALSLDRTALPTAGELPPATGDLSLSGM